MSKKFNRTAKKTGSDRPEPKNYTQILIVSEDTQSSVNYLNALWRELSKSKDNALQKSVQIIPNHKGSSPDQVLASAEEKNNEMGGFNEIFCVMDVDSHKTLNNTLQRIRGDGFRNKGYHAIVSNPCFEYWVYLHLCESDAPFNRTGSKSSCDGVSEKIKEYDGFKDYGKAVSGLHQRLCEYQATAIERAKRLLGADYPENKNPSTNFYELIERLIAHSKDPFLKAR